MKKSNELYAGIDLHSDNLVVAIVDGNGKRVDHQRLPCDLEGVERYFSKFRKKLRSVAVESTFNWYWLVDGLEILGYKVQLANPAGLSQYDGLKSANDKTDAFFIAELLRLGILPTGHIYHHKLRPVRDLLRRRASLVGKRTSLILSLRNLHIRTRGHALNSNIIKQAKLCELVGMFDDASEKLTVEVQKSHVDSLGASIKRIERHVLETSEAMPHAQELSAIPGIGRILSMTILMEIGDINRFASAENFASYARTVRSERTSNGKKKGENNRKCGNRYLSWAFMEASNFIRRYDERAAHWHARKAGKTNKVIATKAIACKLAKAVWHILKDGRGYDGDLLFGPLPKAKTKST